ncbi:Bifunctional NAD(P)H-hydrate repair enzyme Nnr [subsurface metagenome]
MKVVTTNEMKELERGAAKQGLPNEVLMENAGLAIAQRVKGWLGSAVGRQILVLVGPGNNGGDGLVAARHLHDWGARINIYLCNQRREDDPNYHIVTERGIPTTIASEDKHLADLDSALSSSDVVIDALFGTGKLRPLEGVIGEVLTRVRGAKEAQPGLKVIAIDLPSGLDADSGAADPSCLAADLTVTLGYPKIGLFSFPGRDLVGELMVADIGIPVNLGEGIATELITGESVRSMLPQRPHSAHKGTFGRVLVCAGSLQYIGAAYLACEGAMRVGAGLVTLAVAQSLQPILAAKLTEVTYVTLPEAEPGFISNEASSSLHERLADYDVLLMGCGLSQHPSVMGFIRDSLLKMPPSLSPLLVLDADVLNTLAQTPQWWQRLRQDAILTPHPGEMGRLSGLPVEEIGRERLRVAREEAALWHKTVVLKGAHTVVASPGGEVKISAMANPGLASAGTGDVLSGAIAGLLAQGLTYIAAAACGVYLHGLAGETVRAELGDAGMVASDLLPALPRAIKKIREG